MVKKVSCGERLHDFKLKLLSEIRHVQHGVPIVWIAGITALLFYTVVGFHIPLFFTILNCIAAGVVYLLFRKSTVRRLLLFYCAASAITLIAAVRLDMYRRPVQSLLNNAKVTAAKLELIGEPLPARNYYQIPAKVLTVYDAAGNEFSASGNANVFFPKAVIDQTMAGGITTVGSSKHKNGQLIFASGMIIKAAAKYQKSDNKIARFFCPAENPESGGWISGIARLRGSLRFFVMRLLYGWGAAGALLLALVSADKNFLQAEVQQSFIDAGLAHVLALSGMHVSIIGGAVDSTANVFINKNISRIISVIAIVFFVWFAGAGPSLTRALGMALILLAAKMLTIPVSVLSALSLMFVIHVCTKPVEALTLGFLLSYTAMLGILLIAPAVTTVLEGKMPDKLLGPVSTGMCAQTFTVPIISATIKRVALVGIVSSVVVSPLIAMFLKTGLICIALTAIGMPSGIASFVLNGLYSAVIAAVNFFKNFFIIQISNNSSAVLATLVALSICCIFIYSERVILQRRLELVNFNMTR